MRFVTVVLLVVTAPSIARASSVGGVVTHVATDLVGGIPQGALVVAAPLESDTPPLAGRGDELALRVAALVAGKIPGAHAAERVATLDDARAVASRASRLVYVRVRIESSQLRVTVDAYPVVRNVWDRARLPAPPPNAHAYAAAPVDAEVRSFFPPIPLVLTNVYKASGADVDVLAAACGDLDGDGAPEILLTSRERVSIAQLAANKLRVIRTAPLGGLAKRAPVPLREPLGGASIEIGRAFVGTSDRGGVAIGAALDSPHALAGIPIGAGWCAPVSTSRLALDGTIPCERSTEATAHEPDYASGASADSFDAASAFDLVAPSGRDQLAIASSEDGKLHVRVNGVEKASFDDAGAQVALFDADLDGVPEVAFSTNLPDDFITIATLADPAPRVITRIPASAGVRALAACPPMARGGGALVAVVGTEVWLVR